MFFQITNQPYMYIRVYNPNKFKMRIWVVLKTKHHLLELSCFKNCADNSIINCEIWTMTIIWHVVWNLTGQYYLTFLFLLHHKSRREEKQKKRNLTGSKIKNNIDG